MASKESPPKHTSLLKKLIHSFPIPGRKKRTVSFDDDLSSIPNPPIKELSTSLPSFSSNQEEAGCIVKWNFIPETLHNNEDYACRILQYNKCSREIKITFINPSESNYLALCAVLQSLFQTIQKKKRYTKLPKTRSIDNELFQVLRQIAQNKAKEGQRIHLNWSTRCLCINQNIDDITWIQFKDINEIEQLAKFFTASTNLHVVYLKKLEFPKHLQKQELLALEKMASRNNLNLSDNKFNDVEVQDEIGKINDIYRSLDARDELVSFTSLDVSRNALKCVPYLKGMLGFDKIVKLDLSNNNMTELNVGYIPPTIQVLHLQHNALEILGSLQHCSLLEELDVSFNKVWSLSVNDLPSSIRVLCMQDNNLRYIGEMEKLLNLEILNLENNQVEGICSLPLFLKEVNLRSNPLVMLLNSCFPSDKVYEVIKQGIDMNDLSRLQCPPKAILQKSLEEIKMHYKNNMFLESYRKRLILLGPVGVGKSSLLKWLIQGKYDEEQYPLSSKLNVKTWHITEEDTYQVYDQDRNDTMSIISPVFVCEKSIVLTNHNMCSTKSIETAVKCFQNILQQQPNTIIHFILSHIDQVTGERERKSKVETFKEAIMKHLDREIKHLTALQRKLRKENNEDHAERLKKLHRILENYNLVKSKAQFFPVSNTTGEGIEELRAFLQKVAVEERQKIARTWTCFFNLILQQEKRFLSLLEVKLLFEKVNALLECRIDKKPKKEGNEEELNRCLQYLNEKGLILWQRNDPHLRKYIFHKLDFLISVFQSVLHEDLKSQLKYECNDDIPIDLDESEFDTAIDQYYSEGLLSAKLLEFLLSQHKLAPEEEAAIIQIMQSFSILHPVSFDGSETQDFYFIPWFIRKEEHPTTLNPYSPMKFDAQTASFLMEYEFFNEVPINVCEQLCLSLQKHAVRNHYHGARYAWCDGLMVTLNQIQAFVFKIKDMATLRCFVTGPNSNLPQLWTNLRQINTDFEESVLPKWNGIVKSKHLVCGHCVLKEITPAKRWPTSEIWPKKDVLKQQFVSCKNEVNEKVPTGLILPITDSQHNEIRDVEKYVITKIGEKIPKKPVDSNGLPLSVSLFQQDLDFYNQQIKESRTRFPSYFVMKYISKENKKICFDVEKGKESEARNFLQKNFPQLLQKQLVMIVEQAPIDYIMEHEFQSHNTSQPIVYDSIQSGSRLLHVKSEKCLNEILKNKEKFLSLDDILRQKKDEEFGMGTLGGIMVDPDGCLYGITVNHIVHSEKKEDGRKDPVHGEFDSNNTNIVCDVSEITGSSKIVHFSHEYRGAFGSQENKKTVDIAALKVIDEVSKSKVAVLYTKQNKEKVNLKTYRGPDEDMRLKPVQKFGHTSLTTHGVIVGVNKELNIEGFFCEGVFVVKRCYNQQADLFSKDGDSGSLVIGEIRSGEAPVYGLCWAIMRDYIDPDLRAHPEYAQDLEKMKLGRVSLCIRMSHALDCLKEKFGLSLDWCTGDVSQTSNTQSDSSLSSESSESETGEPRTPLIPHNPSWSIDSD